MAIVMPISLSSPLKLITNYKLESLFILLFLLHRGPEIAFPCTPAGSKVSRMHKILMGPLGIASPPQPLKFNIISVDQLGPVTYPEQVPHFVTSFCPRHSAWQALDNSFFMIQNKKIALLCTHNGVGEEKRWLDKVLGLFGCAAVVQNAECTLRWSHVVAVTCLQKPLQTWMETIALDSPLESSRKRRESMHHICCWYCCCCQE